MDDLFWTIPGSCLPACLPAIGSTVAVQQASFVEEAVSVIGKRFLFQTLHHIHKYLILVVKAPPRY